MDKTIYSAEYAIVLQLLREARSKVGVTQVELAERIDETQSYVSKIERGELRLDVVELRTICRALGVGFPAFIRRLENALGTKK